MEHLNLFCGDDLSLTEDVTIRHNTLLEIKKCGYDKYYKYMTDMVIEPVDVADVLWFEGNVWYEDIKSPWDFFLQRSIAESASKSVGFITDGKLIYVEDNCLFINEFMRDALNFFLGFDTEYIVLAITKDGTKQNVIYALKWSDEFNLYTLEKDCFKFTEIFYNITKEYLKDINWFHPKPEPQYDFVHGGNKSAKKYILKQVYQQRKRKRGENVSLESIASSLVARGQRYKDVLDYPIYVVYNQYYRLVKIDEYNNTMQALYSGCLNTKEHPIQWDKINWSSIIK